MKELSPATTAFIMGAVVDFVQHLNDLPSPIVVGREYKNDRIIDEIRKWATNRNVSLKSIDLQSWIQACEKEYFKDETN